MTKSKINLGDMNIDQMLDLREEIDARLADLAKDELDAMERRAAVLSKFAKPSMRKKLGPKPAATKTGSSRRASKLKGVKAPAKFRDPKTGNSWSGRGLTPVWLREYEAKGGKRDDLAV